MKLPNHTQSGFVLQKSRTNFGECGFFAKPLFHEQSDQPC
jgi:hypothetical protein